MLTKSQVTRLKKLIKNYADWQEADSWKGGGDPQEIPNIEKNYKAAKGQLDNYLKSLCTTTGSKK